MPLRDDVLQPIPGTNPGGANLRYDPIYDKIKEARREDDDVPQGEWTRARKVADWPLVVKLAGDALATKSKDLQLAAWLTEALLHQEALGGLSRGLGLLRDLLDRFWDHLYPELEDGDTELRAAPLDWVGRYLQTATRSVPLDKAGHDLFRYKESRTIPSETEATGDEKKAAARQAAMDDKKLMPEEFAKAFEATPKPWFKQLVADVDASVRALGALDTETQGKFGDHAPSYSDLAKALGDVGDAARDLLAKKLETDPDPVSTAAPEPGAVGGPGAPTAGAAGGSGGLTPEPASAEDAAGRIAVAARFLRRADPRNPAPYLLLRGFRWGELRAHGRDLDPRLLVAPPTHLRAHLKGLLLDGKWAELLDAAEDVMAAPFGRGWLDLQRYELTACEQLGTEYEYVGNAIRAALGALLADLPRLPELTLMDDTPTANVETRAWLGGLPTAAAEVPGLAATDGQAPDTRPRTGRSAADRARDEVRAGRPQKGIEVLLRDAEQETSARARFLSRAGAAGIMVDSGLEAVALPMLRQLHDLIEAHKLEDWEPGDVVARPLGLLYRCLIKLGGEDEFKTTLYRRICRLDPMQAIAFPQGPGGGSTDGPSGG